MQTIERYRGALLGLATGDALGAPLEFQPPGTFAPVNDMIGGGAHHILPGQWTDDTSMALCLADSLLESDGFDPLDQMRRYLRWHDEGYLSSTGECFDVGITTGAALSFFKRTGAPFCGWNDPQSAGNGCLMRLAPVPLYYACMPQEAVERSGESARTTHGATTAADACRYFGGLLVGAVQGVGKEELLLPYYCPIPDYWQRHRLSPEIAEVADGSFKTHQPPQIEGAGYVVRSLEAALWAFYHSDSFRDGALLAVNLGNDADTTGAIYGQLAGAFYGEGSIPQGWLGKLALRATVESFADRLYTAAGWDATT